MLKWERLTDAGMSWQSSVVGYVVFGLAIAVALTHHPHLPSLVSGFTNGKLKTSVKVGANGATQTGRFGISNSHTPIYGGFLEVVTFVVEMESGVEESRSWSSILQVGSPGFP